MLSKAVREWFNRAYWHSRSHPEDLPNCILCVLTLQQLLWKKGLFFTTQSMVAKKDYYLVCFLFSGERSPCFQGNLIKASVMVGSNSVSTLAHAKSGTQSLRHVLQWSKLCLVLNVAPVTVTLHLNKTWQVFFFFFNSSKPIDAALQTSLLVAGARIGGILCKFLFDSGAKGGRVGPSSTAYNVKSCDL